MGGHVGREGGRVSVCVVGVWDAWIVRGMYRVKNDGDDGRGERRLCSHG